MELVAEAPGLVCLGEKPVCQAAALDLGKMALLIARGGLAVDTIGAVDQVRFHFTCFPCFVFINALPFVI